MIKHYNISNQAYGEFNSGDIIENKPLGFPQDVNPNNLAVHQDHLY